MIRFWVITTVTFSIIPYVLLFVYLYGFVQLGYDPQVILFPIGLVLAVGHLYIIVDIVLLPVAVMQKIVWLLVILTLSIIGTFLYWYLCVYRDPKLLKF